MCYLTVIMSQMCYLKCELYVTGLGSAFRMRIWKEKPINKNPLFWPMYASLACYVVFECQFVNKYYISEIFIRSEIVYYGGYKL